MTSPSQHSLFILRNSLLRSAAALLFAISVVLTQSVQAQTLQVLHTFTCGEDGAYPSGGLIFDARGDLYGTAADGGGGSCMAGCGTAFQLKPTGSGWVFNPLHRFDATGNGGNDGTNPEGSLVFGRDGLLYGTTGQGGGNGCGPYGCGTVYSLQPPAHACTSAICPWTENILYAFSGASGNGTYPAAGVTFDAAGNLYGTTVLGGGGNATGTVFELSPTQGGGWTEQVLHAFGGQRDGVHPEGGVIFDTAGNLYSTTNSGGIYDFGTVFELTPAQGGGWTEQVIYNFYSGSDGEFPEAGLIFDAAGNLYGTTNSGGTSNYGTVFELTPAPGGGWTEQVLHLFGSGQDGANPAAGVVFDSAGNLYGTTFYGGPNNGGTVFELSPTPGGGWTEQVLYSFNQSGASGYAPAAGVILDAAGNLYGTTLFGAADDCGTVYELTPGSEAQDRSR